MRKAVLAGLILGVLLAFVSVEWFFQSSNTIVFETDEQKTLGLQIAPPQVALKPLSVDEIATRLGFPNGNIARTEGLAFADRIAAGFRPPDWAQTCKSQHTTQFCTAVDDYFSNQALVFAGKPRVHYAPVSFDLKKMARLQHTDFNSVLGRATDWSFKQIQRFADPALKVEDCPHNFSLVLARKLENYLDSLDAWNLFDKLQAHGIQCMTTADPWAEYLYLRAGLFDLARSKEKEALPLLQKAAESENKREEYRTLYWLSYVLKNAGRETEAKAVRERLYSQYPSSWHTILAKVEERIDPFEAFTKRPVYADEYESKNTIANQRLLWLQLMLGHDEAIYAAKRYGEFTVKTSANDVSAGLLQFLARTFDRSQLYRLQIITMSQLNNLKPESMTEESLRLLYPKPFFEDFDSQSPHLDTAILLGLARQESSFDPGATSKANARGLLQILPSTARTIKRVKHAELYDYGHNIEIGARYVLSLIDTFDGSVEKALAAYNAGMGTVHKWESRYKFVPDVQLFLDLIPYRETRDYVPSILRNAYWYHRLFPDLTKSLKDTVQTSGLLRLQLFPNPKDKPKDNGTESKSPDKVAPGTDEDI